MYFLVETFAQPCHESSSPIGALPKKEGGQTIAEKADVSEKDTKIYFAGRSRPTTTAAICARTIIWSSF
jgi:hypothetical protein